MTLNLPSQPGPRPPGFTPKPSKESRIKANAAKRAGVEAMKRKADKEAGVDRRKREGISPKLRSLILERCHNACVMCGQIGTPENPLQIGHVVPVAQGGTNDESNLRAECRDCNLGGGARRRATPKERIDGNKIVSQLAAIVGKKKKAQ